jgi:hypothetical protein
MDGGVNGDKVAVLDLGIGWDLRVFYEMNRTQKRDRQHTHTQPHIHSLAIATLSKQ